LSELTNLVKLYVRNNQINTTEIWEGETI